MTKIKVLFQGDSITDCGRKTPGEAGFNHLEMGPGYPGMITARMMYEHPEVEWEFINRGISGHRIVDLYARWKEQTLNLEPDVLSMLVGVNDTWHEFMRNNGVDVPRYARFYRELLQWSREVLPNIKFVLLDPFVFPEVNGVDIMAAEVAERRAVVAELAKEFDAIHIPLQDIFNEACKLAPQNYWSADGVHPTLAGQYLIANEWYKAVSPMLLDIAKK